jgi:serine/threonine protein kinase/pimeloyl-ACP methyl ester carboxylesterase/tetratricopeptide (TPR) repeat protein
MEQHIHFCTTSDGVRIAYATVGEGPPLVKAANWLNHLEFDWQSPIWRHLLEEFARDHLLVRYDERGNGLSDWDVENLSFEEFVRDLESVVDAVGLSRFPLLGISQGGAVAIAYAVRHPERVSHLILYGAYARGWARRGSADEIDRREALLTLTKLGWGQDNPAYRQLWTTLYVPDAAPAQMQWFNDLQRVSASPENAVRLLNEVGKIDVLDLLPQVRVPTLVLHCRNEVVVPFEEGRLLAASIPGALFVPLEGRNHLLLESESAWAAFIAEVRRFLGTEMRAEGNKQDLRSKSSGKEKLSGRSLPDRYRIVSSLGAGGMGEVYLAQDARLDRKVAIKVLPPELTADERARKRLIREAQAAAKLDHPNICSIYEVGDELDAGFIVMQYVEGETLGKLIQRQPLDLRESLDIAVQIAGALAEAHSRGIVHRDIKPQNVMITARGQVKVLDFGLAKIVQQKDLADSAAETESLLTEPGMIIGTVPYMSPEQVRGETLDARSDIFSFGAVVYEMVSGHQPFAAESAAATISTILTKEPPPLVRYSREVPGELERIVSKALRKDREQRYQTAKDLLIDLKSLSEELTFEAKLGTSTPARSTGESETVTSNRDARVETAPQPPARTAEIGTTRTVSRDYLIGGVRRHKLQFAALVFLLITLAGVGIYLELGHGKAIDSLAVLPFTNVSGDPNTEYLSDGITESLINNLSQLPNLTVMSRNSVFRYKGQEADAQVVGRDLKVQAVLTGRMVQRGDNLSISAELVDVRNNSHLWGGQYNRKLSDILAVQAEISREISEKLRLQLSGEQQKRLVKRHTDNNEAYQLYLKGRYYWNRRTEEGTKRGIEYFGQAIERDPSYALAYAGIADCYNNLGTNIVGGLASNDVMPKAKQAAMKALEIDETLAEAHTSLAQTRFLYDWDWPGAEIEYKRAIDLNPNYAHGHHWYSHYLLAMGRVKESLAESLRALDLDPLDLPITTHLGWHYLYAREYDRAIEQLRKALDMDSRFLPAHLFLGQAYAQEAMYDKATAELQQAIGLSRENPVMVAVLGYAYAMSGKKGEAQMILHKLNGLSKQRSVPSQEIAAIHTALGEKDQAFEWLRRAYEERYSGLVYLKNDPALDGLRSDPRFADLMRRVGLAP